MGIKKYNAYIPSRGHITSSDFRRVTKDIPEKSLVVPLSKRAGRNNRGKIIVHHRGGGSRGRYKTVDFKRNNKDGVLATVIGIEYDPNKTTNIAPICYTDGKKACILAPQGLTDGMKAMNGDTAEVKLGNCMPLYHIPVDIRVHNIELYPGKGDQLVRSADNSAQLVAGEGKYATLRLSSGGMRVVPIICHAIIGVVGDGKHSLISISKAGGKRGMGIRPVVRGSIVNPSDHPHSGGENKYGVGRPNPCTPWGKPVLDLKVRKKSKQSNRLTVKRRDGRTIR